MLNIVDLGTIMNNDRRTHYPLTQEWADLAVFLAARINSEIEKYFSRYNSYAAIIDRRKEIEPKVLGLDNKYELLIYAAIRTRNQTLLNHYLDKKMARPVMGISKSEFLKPDKHEVDEKELLRRIKSFAVTGDFENIEVEIAAVQK